MTSIASATPVRFTTNEVVNNVEVALNGPYRVSYITVYVDSVKKCYTESNGACTATLNLTEGLHEARYVWASCNNPDSCPHYGEVTHYVNVPNQEARFDVRIPTVGVRWYTEYGVGISLNGQWRVWALGGGTGTTNVMSGCYTASYYKPYPGPAPAWPVNTQIPDVSLHGFDRVCFGSSDTYPTPTPDDGSDTNPPHVRITIPDYWP
jgi:hypothetical protein